MSGVLYTPEKVPVSKQDFSPKRQSPGKEKILKKINELGESAAISTRSRKEYRAYVSKRRRVRHSEGYQQQRLRDATFYGGISIASICIILITAFITSGVIGNMTSTTVALNDNGRVTYASTSARSVNDFLAKNSITVGSGDVLNVSLNDSISEGETIEIRRALPLTIHNGTEVIELNMLAGTVDEALEKAGVEVTVDDEVYPAASSYITAGMTISVIHVTYEYVTENEVIHFKEVTKSSNSLAYGDKILQTEGQNGVQQNTIKVTYKNGKEVSRETVKQEVTKKAVDRVVLVGTYVEPKPQPSSGSNSSSNSGSGSSSSNSGGSGSSSGNSNSGIVIGDSLLWPANSHYITSNYGYRIDPVGGILGDFHLGLDIAGSVGDPVYAAQGGTVIRASWFSTYGNCVDIQHPSGLVTRYAHLSAYHVSVGDTVSQGQIIADIGATGNVTGPHLHFETIVNGSTVDPQSYF